MFRRKIKIEEYLGSGVKFLDGNYLYTKEYFLDFLQSQGFERGYKYVGHEKEGVNVVSIFKVKKDGKNYKIKISPFQCSVTATDKKSLKSTQNLDKVWQRFLIRNYSNYNYMLNHHYLMLIEKVEKNSKEIVEYYAELLKKEAQEVVSGVIRQKLLPNDAKLKQLESDRISMFRYDKYQKSRLIKRVIDKHGEKVKTDQTYSQKSVKQNNVNGHVQDAVVNIRKDETGEFSCENCK